MQLLSCWPPVQVHGFHHGAELHSAAVSPDGKFLGTAGADGQVGLGSRGGPGDGENRNGGLNDGDLWFNYVFHGGRRG